MRISKPFGAHQHATSSISSLLAAAGAFLLPALLCPPTAQALECGAFTFPKCSGEDVQYAGTFDPKVGYGGFGAARAARPKHPWCSSTAMAIAPSTGLRPWSAR